MEIPKKLIDCLNKSEISYEILHHPAAFTAQTIAAVEHIKGHHHAKVVMVKSGNQHLMAVLPADHRIDLQKLEKITGEPASVETEKEFGPLFPDCAVGTMPPFGNLYAATNAWSKVIMGGSATVAATTARRVVFQGVQRSATRPLPRIDPQSSEEHEVGPSAGYRGRGPP